MPLFSRDSPPSPRIVRRQLHGMSDHILRDIGLDPIAVSPRILHARLW
tara:strand:- start:4057 stop:4200 length:144 start_codon:yes stop_codon:yes gene_type:complete